MATFESRPVKVDAVQWRGNNTAEVAAFIGPAAGSIVKPAVGGMGIPGEDIRLWTAKSQAYCLVHRWDFIIREADDTGFYPCPLDAMERRYELRYPNEDGRIAVPARMLT
jgi:hypothetical protein